MNDISSQEQAVELLQQLGLKEYEAKCFVALSRLPGGTAKEISEISEVPRTRVYDAVRVLEQMGLVEIQHSNPQRFRVVGIEEAVDTLQVEYERRTNSLRDALGDIEPAESADETEVTHEVWAMSGDLAISNRTRQLVTGAEREIVFVIGHETAFTEEMVEALRTAKEGGVSLVLGTVSDELRDHVEDALPGAEVYVSGLEWLRGGDLDADDTEISRLLLVDRSTILVSSLKSAPDADPNDQHAVFGHGFDNGLVTIVRRLLATGLLPRQDPGVGQ